MLANSLWILNPEDRVVAVLTNENSSACPFTKDMLAEQLGAYQVLEFEAPLDHEDAQHLVAQNQVAIYDDDDDTFYLFGIRRVDEIVDANGLRHRKVWAESAATELNTAIIRPLIHTGKKPSEALAAVLTDTRWDVGDCFTDATKSYSISDYPTALKSVLNFAALWELEPRFRVELTNGKVTGRFVDLLERRGKVTGKVFEYAKDLKGVQRTQDSIQLCTALIGIGANVREGVFVNFEDEVWTTPTNPTNKPANQDWVGDEDARTLYGLPDAGSKKHIFGVYQNPDITTASYLLEQTYKALQEVKEPAYSYTVSAALIDRLPAQTTGDTGGVSYAHEKVSLGDTVLVKDFTLDPPLAIEARVVELKRSVTDPTGDEVTLGKFRKLVVETLDPRQQELWLYRQAGQFEKGITTFRQDAAPTVADDGVQTGDLWLKSSDNDRLHRWNGSAWIEQVRNTTFRQSATPTGAIVGDLWLDTDDEKLYRYNGSTWDLSTPIPVATTSRPAFRTTGTYGAAELTVRELDETHFVDLTLDPVEDSEGTHECVVGLSHGGVYGVGRSASIAARDDKDSTDEGLFAQIMASIQTSPTRYAAVRIISDGNWQGTGYDPGEIELDGKAVLRHASKISERAVIAMPLALRSTSNTKLTAGGYYGNDGASEYAVAFLSGSFPVEVASGTTAYLYLRFRLYSDSTTGPTDFKCYCGSNSATETVSAGAYEDWVVRVSLGSGGVGIGDWVEIKLTTDNNTGSTGNISGLAFRGALLSTYDALTYDDALTGAKNTSL